MFRVTIGDYVLQLISSESGGPPFELSPAILTESADAAFEPGRSTHVAVYRSNEPSPRLNLELKNSPFRRDFVPGFLLVPETDVLFVGAGTRVLIYDLKEPKRLLTDEVVGGFWGWEQHRNMVFMLSEVELSAFDLRGARLWPTFVDPPWVYEVTESTVVIEDFSGVRELDLRSGMPIG